MERQIDLTKAREKAIEMGVYMPLGAYSKVRDQISELDGKKIRRTYRDFVTRGEKRTESLERMLKRRARTAQSKAEDATQTAKRGVGKARSRGAAAGAAIAPKMPRVAAPKNASELPVKGYDSLTADEILNRTRGLTQTDLAKVYKYEKAHEDRATVLDGLQSRFIELPIPTYDALTVDEISERIGNLSASERKTLLRYEKETKARSTIIDKLEAKL